MERYTDREVFCQSSILIPGLQLLDDQFLGVAQLFILFYFFIGIAVASDILMESITQITSKTEDVEVRTLEGKSMMVGIPIWNPRIVYLSLMAIGGALPEIFLSFMSQFSDKDGQDTFALSKPNTLGTIALVGSAAFNLFVVTGFAIISAN
jgi:Ca2+/Na+ antiporter